MNTHALEELYLTFTAIQYRSNCNIPSLDINAHTFIDFEPVYKYWSAGLHRIYVFLMGILEVQIYVCKTEEEVDSIKLHTYCTCLYVFNFTLTDSYSI